MRELERLLWHIESLGGRITTRELMDIRIYQYQRALKQLREKLILKNWVLTEAEPIPGQRRNFMYRLIKPEEQWELFDA